MWNCDRFQAPIQTTVPKYSHNSFGCVYNKTMPRAYPTAFPHRAFACLTFKGAAPSGSFEYCSSRFNQSKRLMTNPEHTTTHTNGHSDKDDVNKIKSSKLSRKEFFFPAWHHILLAARSRSDWLTPLSLRVRFSMIVLNGQTDRVSCRGTMWSNTASHALRAHLCRIQKFIFAFDLL